MSENYVSIAPRSNREIGRTRLKLVRMTDQRICHLGFVICHSDELQASPTAVAAKKIQCDSVACSRFWLFYSSPRSK
jgi:hypothetical protein